MLGLKATSVAHFITYVANLVGLYKVGLRGGVVSDWLAFAEHFFDTQAAVLSKSPKSFALTFFWPENRHASKEHLKEA